MRIRFALAAMLTILLAAPLMAQPYSSGTPTPGSWAHGRPYYPSQAYFENMAYGGDGYWEYFGGGGCATCDPCSGHWGGFFRKCTTVNGCPYWASDPCCRTIPAEMACDVKCFFSNMHCSNHTCLRSALCRALCQDCSSCGSCGSGCSTCAAGGYQGNQGYHSKPTPTDASVDPFEDDAPRTRGAYYSPYSAPAPAPSRTAREPSTSSVLRADHAEPLIAPKDETPGRGVSAARRREEQSQSAAIEAERLSQYQRAQAQAAQQQAQATQSQQQAQQYAALQQQYLAAQQAQQQAAQQYAAQQLTQQQAAQLAQKQMAAQQVAVQQAQQQLAAQQYAAQQLAAQQAAQQQAAQQYAVQQAAQQQAALQYAAQQQALEQQAAQQQAYQQQAVQQQYLQQVAAQQYAARLAAQQAAALQQAQTSVLMPQQAAPQLLAPPVASPAQMFQQQAAPPQVQPTAIYWPVDAPEAPRTLNGGTVTADATSRTADTGVEMEILSRR